MSEKTIQETKDKKIIGEALRGVRVEVPTGSLPEPHNRCTCLCHEKPGVLHMQPCCGPSPAVTVRDFTKKNGDGIDTTGRAAHILGSIKGTSFDSAESAKHIAPAMKGTSLELPEASAFFAGFAAMLRGWPKPGRSRKPSNRLDYDRRTREEIAEEETAKHRFAILDTGLTPDRPSFVSGGPAIYEDYSAPPADQLSGPLFRAEPWTASGGERGEVVAGESAPRKSDDETGAEYHHRYVAWEERRALRGDQRAVKVLAELARGNDGK